MRYFFLSLLIFSTSLAHGIDLKFRFKDGYCQKSKAPGFNPEFMGECGNLTGSQLINKVFHNKNLKGGVFNSNFIYLSSFNESVLEHSSFRRSVVLQSDFSHIKAQHLDLRGSHFKSTNFDHSDLQNLFATGSRFIKTSFQYCNLQNANFWGSQLQEIDFRQADLRGANLKTTYVLFSQFEGAKFNHQTQLPFSTEEALNKGMVQVD